MSDQGSPWLRCLTGRSAGWLVAAALALVQLVSTLPSWYPELATTLRQRAAVGTNTTARPDLATPLSDALAGLAAAVAPRDKPLEAASSGALQPGLETVGVPAGIAERSDYATVQGVSQSSSRTALQAPLRAATQGMPQLVQVVVEEKTVAEVAAPTDPVAVEGAHQTSSEVALKEATPLERAAVEEAPARAAEPAAATVVEAAQQSFSGTAVQTPLDVQLGRAAGGEASAGATDSSRPISRPASQGPGQAGPVVGPCKRSQESGEAALRSVIKEMDPTLAVEGASKGKYDNCHAAGKGLFWLYTFGQIRSFSMHANNWKSFLSKSHSCWFIVMYTRSEVTSKFDPKHPWSHNTNAALSHLTKAGETVEHLIRKAASKLHRSGSASNLAYLVVNHPNRSHEHHRAAVLLGREVASLHCIPQSGHDVIGITRPDIVFTNAVNVPKMASVMQKVPCVLMPHHQAKVGGRDPSEMFVFGPRKFWEASCAYSSSSYDESTFYVKQTAETNCLEPQGSCGYFARLFVFTAYALGFTPFFYYQPLGLGLHRLSGEGWEFMIMKGLAEPLSDADSTVGAALDLTRRVKCVVGETSSCKAKKEHQDVSPIGPRSPCWGETSFTSLLPKGGMWICRHYANISDGCRPSE